MSSDDFLTQLRAATAPVILLEGTRDLPADDAPRLQEFARQLAGSLPDAIFRSGNAPGSDEAFASGVCEVDPTRMEYVVPKASHYRAKRHAKARTLSLEAVSEEQIVQLIGETERATPSYAWIIEHRDIGKWRIKLDYLLRDGLKVLGSPEHGFAPANFAFFYLHPRTPDKGGTAHTLRVCREHRVPSWTQTDWLSNKNAVLF